MSSMAKEIVKGVAREQKCKPMQRKLNTRKLCNSKIELFQLGTLFYPCVHTVTTHIQAEAQNCLRNHVSENVLSTGYVHVAFQCDMTHVPELQKPTRK